jgi:hypothetical protein
MFPEYVALKTEKGLPEAIAQAAESQRTTASEFMRQAIRKAIVANGVSLPPYPDQRIGRKPR